MEISSDGNGNPSNKIPGVELNETVGATGQTCERLSKKTNFQKIITNTALSSLKEAPNTEMSEMFGSFSREKFVSQKEGVH